MTDIVAYGFVVAILNLALQINSRSVINSLIRLPDFKYVGANR